ncbi:hypothetical protein CBL_20185, partial [Carabus blaptoides fortunei]
MTASSMMDPDGKLEDRGLFGPRVVKMVEQNVDALTYMISTMGLCSKLPDFSGNSEIKINDFITQLEYLSGVGNWPADKTILLAKVSLKGDARLFVESHPILKSTQDGNVFRKLLKERFAPIPDSKTIEKQFVNCYQRKGES